MRGIALSCLQKSFVNSKAFGVIGVSGEELIHSMGSISAVCRFSTKLLISFRKC
jgi:hypothetical protein